MIELTIGIDISKDHLDAACFTSGRQARFAYDAAGLKALRHWIGPVRRVARVVYEATGRYHARLEQALVAWPLVKVDPLRARRFAEATGTRAKTDAVAQNARFQRDARMLARMGAQLALPPDPPAAAGTRELKVLQTARDGLVRDRTALVQREKHASLPLLRRHAARALRLVEAQIAEVEAAIAERIAADPARARRQEILVSIPGAPFFDIGPQFSALLVVGMPELGTASAKEIAALAGVAPTTRQSGQWTGKAWISGGRAEVRSGLFMPTLNAVRHNPEIRHVYDRLVAAGKPKKLALVAAMRKLLILANVLITQDRPWEPRPA